MHEGYRIVISGTRPGFTPEQVGAALAPRLKHPPEDVTRVLRSGQAIKVTARQLDLQAARGLQATYDKSGCASTLESLAPPLPLAPTAPGSFSAEGFRPFTGARVPLLLDAPSAWRNASDDEYLRILHQGAGTFTSSCTPDAGVDLAVWAELRLGSVATALPFLRPFLSPMRLATEAGPAIVAEYRGRKPGDADDTHQLVLCLCPPEGAVSLNITATVAAFDRHQALYQWLLRTQLQRHAPTGNDPARMPGTDQAETQFEIGWRFAAARDFASAAHWFGRAAEQGHAEAQFHLGGFLVRGQGVARDEARGFAWCRRAAEAGWTAAQETLARMYLHGVGVEPDQERAAHWLRRAEAGRQGQSPS